MPHDGIRQSPRAVRPRVLVVDDHAPMLQHAALTLQEEFTVVARLRDVESLLDKWPAAQPDVVVIDVSLSSCSGFDAVGRLRAAGCRAAIVFLSVHEEPEFVHAAWEAGGLGYVAKRDVGCGLVPAVRAALRGHRYVSAAIVSA
jgi:DNA-binding NarL/FixJ family response regulator